MTNIKQFIEDTAQEFKSESHDDKEKLTGMIGLWVPNKYKEKFDNLQISSNKKFAKALRKIVIKALDSVD